MTRAKTRIVIAAVLPILRHGLSGELKWPRSNDVGGPNGKHMLVNWPDLGDFALAGEVAA